MGTIKAITPKTKGLLKREGAGEGEGEFVGTVGETTADWVGVTFGLAEEVDVGGGVCVGEKVTDISWLFRISVNL